MPLSDHEQRLLEQMERALYAEDPKFADTLRKNHRANLDRKRVALGAVAVLAGLAVLVGGMAASAEVFGVIGFVGMLIGAFVTYRAFSRRETEDVVPGDARVRPKATAKGASDPSGGFMDRMEERWRKRRNDRGDEL